MRSIPILSSSYYHIYNRGNLKQRLFFDKSDYIRFVFLLLYYQSPEPVTHVERHISSFIKNGCFKFKENEIDTIIKNRYVELINFCIMPNHFHLTIHNITDNGLSLYMHRVANAYAKYFNAKYEKTGHVFQGAYKAKIIDTDQQLNYLSAYIHKNPHEIPHWKYRYATYPWSSLQDYTNNRWGGVLLPEKILESFKTTDEYQTFVKESAMKKYLD